MAINYPNDPVINDTHTVGNVTWTWDGLAWSIISTSGGGGDVGGGGTTNSFATIASDNGNVTATSSTDTLTIAGGTDIQTSITGTTVTIDYNGAGGGGGGASSLGDLADVDLLTTPPSTNDVLQYNGTDWTPAAVAGGGGGASALTELSDVPLGLTIAQLYEPAIVMLRVGNTGTSGYNFTSHYTGDNPTIFAISGTTIAFDLSDITGHPFEIQDSTGTAYNTGLVHVDATGTVSTGASAQGKDSGVLYWRIPIDATSPPNFRYQCTSHIAMVGPITVKNIATI